MSFIDQLPTLDKARAEGLLPKNLAVAETRKLAALVVVANLHRRETWRETRVLPRDLPPLPRAAPAYAVGTFRSWIVADAPTGGSVIEHVTDRAQLYRDVIVPRELTDNPHLFGIESAIESLVPERIDPALECKDLRKTGASAAYRGALAADQQPTFHEFDFCDTIDRGRRDVEQLYRARGKVVQAGVRAFAWPLLHVRFVSEDPTTQLVILPDANAVLHALTGAELEKREEARTIT